MDWTLVLECRRVRADLVEVHKNIRTIDRVDFHPRTGTPKARGHGFGVRRELCRVIFITQDSVIWSELLEAALEAGTMTMLRNTWTGTWI